MAALLACSAVARADTPPTVWDAARDPEVRARWSLHVRVQRLLVAPADEEVPIPIVRDGQRELRLEAARALLEESHAADSPDVRLRFDLGNVYRLLGDLQGRQDMYERAVRVLAPATENVREGEGLTAALDSLAYAYAKLNRPREELATWRRYIPLVLDDRVRATDMMNMGEAEMRLGHVDDALATFREVERMCGELPNTVGASQTYVLVLWDLAVALDRSGDPKGALDAMDKIIGMMDLRALDLIDGEGVFFVPAWEKYWYEALFKQAKARREHDPKLVHDYWANAFDKWKRYVDESSRGGNDPWLAVAKVRRDRAERELGAATRRLPSTREHRL